MGEFRLPQGHEAGMEVPSGGSCCANCQFLSRDGEGCTSPYYQEWAGTDRLPKPADRWCSDWWAPSKGVLDDGPKTVGEAFARTLRRR